MNRKCIMEIFGMEISEKIYLPIIILLVGIAIYLVISIVINKKISISKKASKHEQRSLTSETRSR